MSLYPSCFAQILQFVLPTTYPSFQLLLAFRRGMTKQLDIFYGANHVTYRKNAHCAQIKDICSAMCVEG